MHEVSIAEALAELVRGHVPAGMYVTQVHVEAGAWQHLDGGALELAWRAVTAGTQLADASVRMTTLPWKLTCEDCGRSWTNADPLAPCECGSVAVVPQGSGDLRLTELEVEPAASQTSPQSLHPTPMDAPTREIACRHEM